MFMEEITSVDVMEEAEFISWGGSIHMLEEVAFM